MSSPITMLADVFSILSGASGVAVAYGVEGWLNSKIAKFINGTVTPTSKYSHVAAAIAGVGYAGLTYALFKEGLRMRRYLQEFMLGAGFETLFSALWNFAAAATMGKTFASNTPAYWVMKFLADISGTSLFS